MNFSRTLALVFCLLFAAGCNRRVSEEEQTARHEVREALHQRAFARALPAARRVLHFASNDNGAWARLAEAELGMRDRAAVAQTLAEWRRAVSHTSPKYEEDRGDLALAEGRPTEALAAWQKAVAGKDRRARVFVKIARLQQAAGHWQESVLAWTRALSSGQTAGALINRAICYRHLHSWEAASADLQMANKMAPRDPLVRQEYARSERLGKFLAEARDLDRQVRELPNDAGLLGDRALLFLRAGDAPLALDDANRAAQLAPKAVRPKLLRSIARREIAENSATKNEDPIRLEDLTPEFLQTISRLDAELAAEPESAELLANRAWQLNEIGQPRLALDDAQRALKSDPQSAGANTEASYALEKLGREGEAYARIKRATELDPHFSTAWQYRGELEMERAEFTTAIDSLTRALAINRTPAALARREECYRKVGLLAKADDDRKAREEISATR
jgi:tetratricopeptide (TPR) repeat protein